MSTITICLKPQKEIYSELEAATALGITLERLHMLLDQNIFADGSTKPSRLFFRPTDLVMLEFWHNTSDNPKIIRMPNPGRV